MAEHEKISVIIPAYNTAKWLPACLDSVLAQSYGNLEVIVVDDGSSDHTQEVVAAYCVRDARVRGIRQPNSGVSAARIRGVQEARGEWIGFVDSDDTIEKDMYQRLLDNAWEHRADISHCGYQVLYEDGRTRDFYNTGVLCVHERAEGLRELLSGQRIEPGLCNKLYRKQLLTEMLDEEVMDTSIRINEDLLMNFFLFSRAEKTVFEDFCPYHYMARSSSASHQSVNLHRILDPVRVKKIILEKAGPEIREEALRLYLNGCINSYISITWAKRGEFEEWRKKLHGEIAAHRAVFGLLSRKRRIIANVIVCAPAVFRRIYPVYARHLQHSKYE